MYTNIECRSPILHLFMVNRSAIFIFVPIVYSLSSFGIQKLCIVSSYLQYNKESENVQFFVNYISKLNVLEHLNIVSYIVQQNNYTPYGSGHEKSI